MTESAKKPAYSVTSLMTYEMCPLQYYDIYVRGIPPPRTPAMARGLTIHKLIAQHFGQPSLLPQDAEPDVLQMFDRFKGSRFNVPPVASEKPFLLPFREGDVRGRIDVVLPRADGGLEIVDFKSGKTRDRDDLGKSLQLPLYSIAAGRLFDRPPEELAYTYYFLDSGAEVSFPWSGADACRLQLRVEGVIEAIQREKFTAIPGCTCHACRRERRWRTRRASL